MGFVGVERIPILNVLRWIRRGGTSEYVLYLELSHFVFVCIVLFFYYVEIVIVGGIISGETISFVVLSTPN